MLHNAEKRTLEDRTKPREGSACAGRLQQKLVGIPPNKIKCESPSTIVITHTMEEQKQKKREKNGEGSGDWQEQEEEKWKVIGRGETTTGGTAGRNGKTSETGGANEMKNET